MINTGWNPAQMADYFDILKSSHKVHAAVHQLDMSMNFVRDISDHLIDGSVDIDKSAAITRSAKLVLLDFEKTLHFDAYNPTDGATYFTQLIRVYYGVQRFEGGPIYYVPLMTGPIDDLARDGAVVTLSLTGKEVLAKSGLWTAWVWPAGWAKSHIIQNAMQVHAGENAFDFDYFNNTTVANFPVGAGEDLFEALRGLAEDMGAQLFYNGWGNLRLRWESSNPVFTFTDEWVTGIPDITYDTSRIVNAVRYEGYTPPGYTTPLAVTVAAADYHPFSPVRMGRNGVPRYLPDFVSNSAITTTFEMYIYAYNVLLLGLLQGVNIQFPSLIVPFLEEGDCVMVSGSGYSGKTQMSRMTIPLVGDAEMSVGFLSTTGVKSENPILRTIQPTKSKRKKGGKSKWTPGPGSQGGGTNWNDGPGSTSQRKKRKRRRH